MPFININTNVSVSKAQETAVKTRLGKAIELIPGKSESWLWSVLSRSVLCISAASTAGESPLSR